MARVAGIDIPPNKRVVIGLTYVFGVGTVSAKKILQEAEIDQSIRVKNLTEDQVSRLSTIIDKHYTVEGTLRRQVTRNIQRLRDISSYRGLRHRKGLPVRGQRTKTNARTRKGPRKTVAGKKITKEKK